LPHAACHHAGSVGLGVLAAGRRPSSPFGGEQEIPGVQPLALIQVGEKTVQRAVALAVALLLLVAVDNQRAVDIGRLLRAVNLLVERGVGGQQTAAVDSKMALVVVVVIAVVVLDAERNDRGAVAAVWLRSGAIHLRFKRFTTAARSFQFAAKAAQQLQDENLLWQALRQLGSQEQSISPCTSYSQTRMLLGATSKTACLSG